MKKFLSLVLALVMTMSLVTVSAGAKDFNDSDKISDIAYEEAVNVMSEMGIIDGYADGNFQPQGTLTRGAAAKIIACMMLGKTTAESLGTQAAPFKDVPVGSTFAGYIAYCSEAGIIDGYSDGTFRPGNTLTGFAFLKMLLTALGYDSAIEGYANNANWTVNVAGRAKQVGLLDGNDNFVGTRAATREEACLYAVNALQATLVEYSDKGSSITINGAVISTGASNATYVTSNVYDAATSIDDYTDNEHNGWTVEFAEKYQPDLRLKDTADAFGRPAHIWTWKNDEIGTYVDYDKMVAEYTVKVTGRDLYDLLGKAALDECDVYTYVDGETARTVLGDAYFTENNIVRDNDDGVGETGKGVLTQVFHDTKNDVITIAVINTYLAKAEEDYDDKDEDVDLMVYSITQDGHKGQFVKYDDKEVMTVEAEDFDIEDVTEDQLFLVTVADGKIQTMADPEIMSEASISKFSSGKYVISGGTQYDYADTAMYDEEVLDKYTGVDETINLKDLSYNIILDPYGYMIGVELNEDPTQYLFLTGIDAGASNLAASNADANVIFTDGKMDTITVNMRKSEDVNGDRLEGGAQLNTWCSYTVNSAGVYTLKQIATSSADDPKSMQSWYDVQGKDEVKIDSKHVSMQGEVNTAKRVYGNDDTIYINVELDAVVGTRNSGDAWIIDDVESVTVGSKNVALTVKDADELYKPEKGEENCTYPTNEIYPLFDDDNYVIAVVTIAENEGSTTGYAYITSSKVQSEEYKGDDDLWIFTREAVVGGKVVDLTEIGDAVDVLNELKQGNWYKIKYDADGNVRGYDEIEGIDGLSDGKINDGLIDDVADLEDALDEKDTVLLDQEFELADHCTLTFKNGTLYTDVDQTKGININPDVNVVLILASVDKNGKVSPFDDVDDSYTGYSGLEKALRNLDTAAVDFVGNLAAIVEGKDGATTIILDERTGTAAKDYNPLEAMTVTFELRDRQNDRLLATVVNKYLTKVDVNASDAAFTKAISDAGWGTYEATPDTAWSHAYDEGEEYTVTFYYTETEEEVVLDIPEGVLVQLNGRTVRSSRTADADIFDEAIGIRAYLMNEGYTNVQIEVEDTEITAGKFENKTVKADYKGVTVTLTVNPTTIAAGETVVAGNDEDLQAAIDAGAGTIYLGSATYNIAASSIDRDIEIIGNGDTTLSNVKVSAGDYDIKISGVNFVVDGGYGINLVHGYVGDVTIEDCVFNCRYGIYIDAAGEISVTGCTFNVTVCPFGWTNAEKVVFTGNTVNGTPERPYIENHDEDTVVDSDYPLKNAVNP